MEIMDIGNKEEGNVWYWKSTPGKGLMLTVVRTAQQAKAVRFLQLAFDTSGDCFLAGDQHGNIYAFDMSRNRFHLVQKTGQACTALAFNPHRSSEFLVALPDNSIRCFDKDSKQLVSWMRGHEGTVSSISIHSSGQYAVSTSLDAAHLWDLDAFVRLRKLTTRKSVAIQKAFFLPFSNTMLTCFTDDSIFSWETDGLVCKHQLPVPHSRAKISYKAFAVTQDGKCLVAGGRSNLLHLWSLESNQLIRVIQMPPHVRAIRLLEFLPDIFDGGANQVLGVLSQDGLMRFININTHQLLFCLGSHDNGITTAAVSPNGRYIVAIVNNGSINIYCTRSLSREASKAPPPHVEVTSGAEVDRKKSAPRVKARSDVRTRAVKSSSRRTHKVPHAPARTLVEDKENQLPAGLNKKRLLALLSSYGEYPDKYRMFVWRSLLRLPENHAAYSSLTDRGVHAAYSKLHQKYPIKSQKLHRGLQRVLSALAHWAAIFGEVEYLPLIAFPFVKLFQNNPLLCFEVVATVIVNWCQHWFEYFPNPPLNILSMVENLLAHHDRELLRHLVDCGITSQLYVWPLLQTFFSEVLTRDEWLRLFDSVFSNHPSFLLMACVAYVTCCREPLLLCCRKQDFEYFFHHRNNLDVGAVIKEAYRLMSSTPDDIHPRTLLSDFTPLTQGHYPVFNHYPEFLVEYHTQEKERIRVQEMEYLRERQELSALRENFVRRQAEEEAYHAKEVLLQKAEEQRRKLLSLEEEKLAQQRERFAVMERELRVQESLLDATRKRFLKHRQEQRTKQIQALDEEISRKMELREQEIAAAVQDLRVRRRNLEAKRTRLEQYELEKQQPGEQTAEQEVEVSRMSEDQEKKSKPKFLHNTGTNKQVSEVPRAEAGQLEFQRQRVGRLQQVDKDQEEVRLVANMRQMTGVEWDDVRTCDQSQGLWRPRSDTAELKQTTEESPYWSVGLPHTPRVTFADSAAVRSACRGAATTEGARSRMVCLNSSSPSESTSLNLSLDRGRAHLDNGERVLLRKVQQLRQKLAARAREGSANACQSFHMMSSVPQ